MNIVYSISAILILVVMFIQDIKFRAITWYLFPALMIMFSLYSINQSGIRDMMFNTSVNLGFLLLQLVLLTIYFSIKNKRFIWITNDYLGIGDILFFVCIAFLFSPMNFIFFYLISLVVIVLGYLFMVLFRKSVSTVPLAGLQAILVIPLLLLNHFFSLIITSDHLIVNFLLVQ
ncbi:MAG: hypothetical protein ACK40G_01175 [Cytophagaceae bacterium]